MGFPDHERKVSVVTELGMTRNVVLYDNHEGAMDWLVGGTGADPTILKTGGRSFLGLNSLVLKTRTTSPAIGDIVTASRVVSYPKRFRLFVGFRVSASNVTKVDYGMLRVDIHSGAEHYQAAMAFSWQEPGLFYVNSAGATIFTAQGVGGSVNRAWHFIGAELSLTPFQWVRLIGNGLDTDLAGQGLRFVGNVSTKYIMLTLELKNELASAGEAWFDTVAVCECESF